MKSEMSHIVEKVIRLANKGLNADEIANRLKIKVTSVYYLCHRNKEIPKLKSGHRGKIKNIKLKKEIELMKSDGMTYRQIGSIVGLTGQRVQQLIRPEIVNAGTCSQCGRRSSKLHRHHVNYAADKVKLLCASCHGKSNSHPLNRKKLKFVKGEKEPPVKKPCPQCRGTGQIELSRQMSETFACIKQNKEVTATSIAAVLDPDDRFHITTFNNRLVQLLDDGLIKRKRSGNTWIYEAV